MIAGAAGQQNLYSWSLDELARERPVARQLTTTAGAKADVSFSPDSKEVFYLDDGRIQAVTLEQREARRVAVTAELDVDFADGENGRLRPGLAPAARQLLRPEVQRRRLDRRRARRSSPTSPARGRPTRCAASPALMIGELNASHLGINPPPAAPARAASATSASISIAPSTSRPDA